MPAVGHKCPFIKQESEWTPEGRPSPSLARRRIDQRPRVTVAPRQVVPSRGVKSVKAKRKSRREGGRGVGRQGVLAKRRTGQWSKTFSVLLDTGPSLAKTRKQKEEEEEERRGTASSGRARSPRGASFGKLWHSRRSRDGGVGTRPARQPRSPARMGRGRCAHASPEASPGLRLRAPGCRRRLRERRKTGPALAWGGAGRGKSPTGWASPPRGGRPEGPYLSRARPETGRRGR